MFLSSSKENLTKISWKLITIAPNDCSHWIPNTTSAPTIWVAIAGISNKYSPIVRLILWHFLEQFMAPPSAIVTWNSGARYMKQFEVLADLQLMRLYGYYCNQWTLPHFSFFWYILLYWEFEEWQCRSMHGIIWLEYSLLVLDLGMVPFLDLLPLHALCRIISPGRIYAPYCSLCHNWNASPFVSSHPFFEVSTTPSNFLIQLASIPQYMNFHRKKRKEKYNHKSQAFKSHETRKLPSM